MITEERISTFINSFDTGNTPFLNELEQYARAVSYTHLDVYKRQA